MPCCILQAPIHPLVRPCYNVDPQSCFWGVVPQEAGDCSNPFLWIRTTLFFFLITTYNFYILSIWGNMLAGRIALVRCFTGMCEDVIIPACSIRDRGEILNTCLFLIGFGVFMGLIFVFRFCNVLQEKHHEAGLILRRRQYGAWLICYLYPDLFLNTDCLSLTRLSRFTTVSFLNSWNFIVYVQSDRAEYVSHTSFPVYFCSHSSGISLVKWCFIMES